jgi:hypothetical protein
LRATLSSTTPISSRQGRSLVTINFHALAPTANPSLIALVGSVNPTGTQVIRTELEDAQWTFTFVIDAGGAESVFCPDGERGVSQRLGLLECTVNGEDFVTLPRVDEMPATRTRLLAGD